MINVLFHNEEVTIPENSKLTDFLALINRNESGIAIAVNETVITKANWSTTTLQNEDNILIITATQGG